MAINAIHVRFRGRTYRNPKQGWEQVAMGLRRSFREAAGDVKKDLAQYIDNVIQSLIEQHSGAWPGGTSETTLSKRTGGLLEAIRKTGDLTGTQYDNLRATFRLTGQLVVHEYGGTMKGDGKLLTIPLPAALNSNGTPKKRSAREWNNTFVAETKKGNLIIFQRRGGRKIVPLYLLRDTVYVPPRLGFGKAVREQIPYFMEKAADDIVARARR